MAKLDNILWHRGVMAIVNATPDSFYSSSRTQSHDVVAERVRRVLSEGATIVDIGGYSSRPDATDIPVEEEWGRVEMALKATREVSSEVAVSIDTFRAEIVRRAVAQFGEVVVNDITAGKGDEAMLATVAELGASPASVIEPITVILSLSPSASILRPTAIEVFFFSFMMRVESS